MPAGAYEFILKPSTGPPNFNVAYYAASLRPPVSVCACSRLSLAGKTLAKGLFTIRPLPPGPATNEFKPFEGSRSRGWTNAGGVLDSGRTRARNSRGISSRRVPWNFYVDGE